MPACASRRSGACWWYGPAGYRFGDYARLGLPLTIVVAVLVLVLVPLEWGLVR